MASTQTTALRSPSRCSQRRPRTQSGRLGRDGSSFATGTRFPTTRRVAGKHHGWHTCQLAATPQGARRLAVSATASELRETETQLHMMVDMQSVVSVILGGGAGTRLYPLTRRRAKPAVPLGGSFRLIDVPMSNCFNSGISKIYVLTQFNSTSLNRHLARTYYIGSGMRTHHCQALGLR